MWEVEVIDEFLEWWRGLDQHQQEALTERIDLLAERGPDLGRPVVDRIETSRHHNMKELRAAQSGALRVLFAFDPRRTAILLLGGDKTGAWNAWYEVAIRASGRSLRRVPRRDPRGGVDLMARTKFSQLREEVVARPGAAERIAVARAETLEEIRLYELRHREAVSQATLAGRLEVTQGAVSKLEHSDDVRVSTLRQYLEALGARLELVAVFDDERQRVPIHLGKEPEPAA